MFEPAAGSPLGTLPDSPLPDVSFLMEDIGTVYTLSKVIKEGKKGIIVLEATVKNTPRNRALADHASPAFKSALFKPGTKVAIKRISKLYCTEKKFDIEKECQMMVQHSIAVPPNLFHSECLSFYLQQIRPKSQRNNAHICRNSLKRMRTRTHFILLWRLFRDVRASYSKSIMFSITLLKIT